MILAMDGGGTKTHFLLSDRRGKILAEYHSDGCNYLQVGMAGLEQTVANGLEKICQLAGSSPADLEIAVFGIPAYGEISQDSRRIAAVIAKLISCPYEIVNDVKLAWAGSLACQPGIVVLSGTGSMAYGVDPQSNDWRAGGWGHYFGDEGSAFWLGQSCCQLFSKMADGRIPQGPLYTLMRETLGLQQDFGLIDLVAQKMNNARKQTAALAKVLSQAALAGDTQARDLFSQGGRELALMAIAIAQKFPEEAGEICISYAGGVFASGELVLHAMAAALEGAPHRVVLQPPRLEPARGACLYGALQLGWGPDYREKLSGNC